MRSSTSAGANYEEACGAESRADFIHKMQVVLKEMRETLYWLKLIEKSGLVSVESLMYLLSECEELVRMTAKSVITAKSGIKS
jgi:four helix bundle protein